MGLSTLIKNLRFLAKHNLKNNFINYQNLDDFVESLKYEIADKSPNLKIPKIKNIDETIDTIVANNLSICRFGDGELQLMQGKDIVFQKSSPQIALRLKEILSSKNSQIAIAIPRTLFYGNPNTYYLVRNFWRQNGNRFRNIIEQYIDLDWQYYSAELTIAYAMYAKYNFDSYFQKLKNIWENKDIAIICGKTVFDNITHNIFDGAKSVQYLYGKERDAFDDYENLLLQSKLISKDRIIITILGPTAKILAYDLTLEGYQALDLGHVAKSYDYYLKHQNTQDLSAAIKFFNPD